MSDRHNQVPLGREMMYPGNGFPQYPGGSSAPPPSPDREAWGRLCRNQTIGKRVVAKFNAQLVNAGVNILRVRGDDADALNMTLTLSPPKVIPVAFASLPDDLQNQTGEVDNQSTQLSGNNFPGLAHKIDWPEAQATIEWGIGGVNETAVVDMVNGATVNLTASFIQVTASMGDAANSLGTSGYIATPAAYVLSAFVGPGYTRPGNAQRTVYLGSLGGGIESDILPIPRFAKRAYVLSGDFGAAPELTVATLRFWSRPDGSACVGNSLFTGNAFQQVNVPNRAMYFSVLSGMTNAHEVLVVFELSI